MESANPSSSQSIPNKYLISTSHDWGVKQDWYHFHQAGFTLIEALVVVAIIAILAALAVPSFSTALDKQRITGAAEAVLSDLRWARSEAIKRNKPVKVTFSTGSSWSYTINADPASTNTLIKTVQGSDYPSTSLSTASFSGNPHTTFDPTRGDATNGSTIITSKEFSAKVTLSILGRSRICGTMGGYESC